MIIDIETLLDKTILDSDICIVGAGAAGLVLGHEFLHGKDKVIILESGSLIPHPADQEFSPIESSVLKVDKASRVRAFGGTTNVWTGGWKPFDEIDFEKRDWVPYSGWPIKRSDLDPYYERAGKLLYGPSVEDYLILDQETGDIQSTLLRVIPKASLNFGTLFRRSFNESNSVDIYLGAIVTYILVEGSEVREVSVKTFSGKEYTIRAKKFVVACGGIENARILLASNIGNAYDQVGRYYMDHPKGVSGEVFVTKRQNIEKYLEHKDAAGVCTRGLQLSPQAQREKRVLNSYVQIREDFSNDNMLARIIKKIFGFHINRGRFLVRSFMEQEPRPENRVCLSNKKDAFDNPIATVAWDISSFDMTSLQVLHVTLKKYLERGQIGTLKSRLPEEPDALHWPVKTDASHHMGSTRMGIDPKTSVVNADCKVHSTDNLYIGGSSVFSTSGHANPTATIVALALRLADHLKM